MLASFMIRLFHFVVLNDVVETRPSECLGQKLTRKTNTESFFLPPTPHPPLLPLTDPVVAHTR